MDDKTIFVEMTNSSSGMNASDWVALVVAALALIASAITVFYSKKSSEKSNEISIELGELNATTQDKQRFIELISAQRVEWINKIRHEFVEFNKLSHTIAMASFNASKEEVHSDSNDINKDYQDLISITDHIDLLLNPTEIYSKKIKSTFEKIVNTILDRQTFSMDRYRTLKNELGFIQQVILKSEWKRIKIETREGEQIDNEDMERVFNDVGNDISKLNYDNIFNKRVKDNMTLYNIIHDNIELDINEIRMKLLDEHDIDMSVSRILKVKNNVMKNLNLDELED